MTWDSRLLALLLPEFGTSGEYALGRDYSDNHDQFEVPRRRPVSTNAAIGSERRFPQGRAAETGLRVCCSSTLLHRRLDGIH